MPLDPATIEALLKGELNKNATGVGVNGGLPRPIQKGPLRWSDHTEPCTSRGCTSPSFIRIQGAAKCTNHALQTLNMMWLQEHDPEVLDLCTCKAGSTSGFNIHTYDCALFKVTSLHSEEGAGHFPPDELL